jgi:hypothetical protein
MAVCRGHDVDASLPRKYRDRLQTKQDEFQVSQGHHLYTESTLLGQGWNVEASLPLFFLA